MRVIRIFTVVLAVATPLVVSAVPVLAANPVWEGCLRVETGKESEKCASKPTKAFEWFGVMSPVAVSSEGVLTLADKKGGLLKEELALECTVGEAGTVGAESVDDVATVKVTGCKSTAGKCESPSAQALNLPWSTELTEKEKETRDSIKAKTLPGWKMACGKTLEDSCEGEASAKITNNTTNNAVESTFGSESAGETCTRGGKEAGQIKGVEKIEATEDGVEGLSVQPPPTDPHWYSNGARLGQSDEAGGLSVNLGTGTGMFTIRNLVLLQSAICEMTGTGKIWNPNGGGSGMGKFATAVITNCTSANCGSPPALAPRNPGNWTFNLWPSRMNNSVYAMLGSFSLEYICEGGVGTVYSESGLHLLLRITNGGGVGATGCTAPTHTTWMAFSGIDFLSVPGGGVGTLTGNVCIWGASEKITVETP